MGNTRDLIYKNVKTVKLSDKQVQALNEYCDTECKSQSVIIRRALEQYLQTNRKGRG